MDESLPVHITIPADLYSRIAAEASHHDRPVESLLVESLSLLFGAAPLNWDDLELTLDTLSDAQLWAIAHRRMAWAASGHFHDLTARGQQRPLSGSDQGQLEMLIDEADSIMVIRSKALRILQQRGPCCRERITPTSVGGIYVVRSASASDRAR